MLLQHHVFLDELDLLISSKHLLKHDFYKAWSAGELSLECLKEYAKEYYHHVKAFPTYISALHSHTEDQDTRKVLLKNLVEEEMGIPNHPELWKNFALKIGVTEDEIAAHTPNFSIRHLIKEFHTVCLQGAVAEGIAALYAYESQIPAICVSKIDGLKTHYGMKDPKIWEYFSVHMHADVEHAQEERDLLKKYIGHSNMERVREAVDNILNALWNFLTSLCHQFGIKSC